MQGLEKMTPKVIYWHAVNAIKGRWSEGEATIMTSPFGLINMLIMLSEPVGLKLK